MIADTSQCLRKRYLFADNRCRLVKLPFPDIAYVPGDVDMGRTGALAGYDVLCHGAVFFHNLHLVHDGTRGTDLDTSPAEAAPGFL